MSPRCFTLLFILSCAGLAFSSGLARAGDDVPECAPEDECLITGTPAFCSGGWTELCGPEGYDVYEWSTPSGEMLDTPCIQASEEGEYALVVTLGECKMKCAVEVGLREGVACEIVGEPAICEGGSTELCAPADLAFTTWTWPDGSETTDACIQADQPGVYSFHGTTQDGCKTSCSVDVVVLETAPCEITGDLYLCDGGTTELCGPEGVAAYLWEGPDEFVADGRCVEVGRYGAYTLTVTSQDGCQTSCEATVDIVDIFTPCEITGDTTIQEGQSTELCGPSGALTYAWTGPEGFTSDAKCIEVSAAGVYSLEIDLGHGCTNTCEVEVQVESRPECPAETEFTICEGETAELCGPPGALYYVWAGPEGFASEAECVEVSGPGTYFVDAGFELLKGNGAVVSCEFNVIVEDCMPANCPQSVVWWAGQCDKAAVDFSIEDFDQIAKCIDEVSDAIDWEDGLEAFNMCQRLNPAAPVGALEELWRQYVALLANVCTGELGIQTLGGGTVKLDLATEVFCDVEAQTVGDLISLAESTLSEPLKGEEPDPLADLIFCLEIVNMGPPVRVCEDDTGTAGLGDDDPEEPTVQPDAVAFRRLSLAPNPFTQKTTISYALPHGGEVDITVYDVSGRRVRSIVRSAANGGVYRVTWDGRNDEGRAMARGIYYVRAILAGQVLTTRVLYMK